MKPRSLMYTLYGEYIQYYGGEIWVGSLIQLMSKFGISESSVRGAIFRMVQKDLLQVRKIGNKSYYTVTEIGNRRVEDGVKRVYSIKNHYWDGYWRILTYSIPEEKRELRNQIRTELNWTGLGMIANSTWISPNPVENQVLEMIQTYGLQEYTTLFTSCSILTHDNEDIISKGWDLDSIAREYDSFIDKYRPIFEELREKGLNNELTDEECFVKRTELVHEYRKFLFKDPSFPSQLLPDNWSGTKASELFYNIHQLLSEPSVRFFESLFEAAPDKEVQPDREKALNPFVAIY
ncbi:PaaX family transcriptional regulator [Desertibacillus haloalkaliphilus]|uniref:PaaX family transcriptional regulator n=1 Tax=Desertibacillus haloalkaliphilus TaxID=1328930 RepID=UPI001C262C3B|nr:PaaX family transcriptional regulator C-terminal domain-containing protein [Desertibacillus haloalkaliphilus]MBU8908219.1 phenylacetic acid degradation operon negative regulatory protein PaaX [Desertibacillus haloalkaliphilus]